MPTNDPKKQKIWAREWYLKNTAKQKSRAKENSQRYRKEAIEYIKKYLIDHSCVDCGQDNILTLEFDHIERKDKFKNVSEMLDGKYSLKAIKKEIEKCDVRCANCHRIKTAKENGNWKLLLP